MMAMVVPMLASLEVDAGQDTTALALLAVPITAVERGYAVEHGSEALFGLLAQHGAMLFDPVRNCIVRPDQTERRRAGARSMLLEEFGRRLERSRARLERFREV